MEELIETIRAAVSDGATAEARRSGLSACRAIAAKLGAEPASVPSRSPPATGQILDLVIARLRVAVEERERAATAMPSNNAAPPKP